MQDFKREMMQRYEMLDLGLLHHFLGIGVIQIEKGIFIHEGKYANSLLANFGLEDYKPVAIPLPIGEKLKKEDGSDKVDEGLYWKIVGSLLYLTATTPLLSRFMSKIPQENILELQRGF